MNYHVVVQIKKRFQFFVDGEVQLREVCRFRQQVDNRAVEKMIAHGEKKWRSDSASCSKTSNAVLLLPIRIFNETDIDFRRNQSPDSFAQTRDPKSVDRLDSPYSGLEHRTRTLR